MNRTLLIGGLAALTLTVGASAATAQQAAPERTPRAMRADADGDGRLSRTEFVGRRLERLSAADANGDGSVTREELQAVARTRMAARADARFDRMDADDDGAISRTEFDAVREARVERGPRPMRAHRGMGHRGPRMARMAHRRGMESRGPVVIADVEARMTQAFARLDGDGDGYVTPQERRAGRQAMREQRRASRQAPASE